MYFHLGCGTCLQVLPDSQHTCKLQTWYYLFIKYRKARKLRSDVRVEIIRNGQLPNQLVEMLVSVLIIS